MLMYISRSMPPMLLVLFYSRLLEKQHVDTHTHTCLTRTVSASAHDLRVEVRCIRLGRSSGYLWELPSAHSLG